MKTQTNNCDMEITGLTQQRNNNLNNKSDLRARFAEKLSINVVDEALLLLRNKITSDPAGLTGKLMKGTSVDTLNIKRYHRNKNINNNTINLKINEDKIRCIELKVFESDLQYQQSKEILNGLCNVPELDNFYNQ